MKFDIKDCIYSTNRDGKVYFAEIYKVYEDISAYCVVDLNEYRYITVHEDNCFLTEKEAKAFGKLKKCNLKTKQGDRNEKNAKRSNKK